MKIINTIKYQTQSINDLLKKLEIIHGRLSLTMLTQWERLDYFSPNLYSAISGVFEPSWGKWNRLIIDLGKMKKEIVKSEDANLVENFSNLENFHKILEFMNSRISKESSESFVSIGKEIDIKFSKIKISSLLEAGRSIRNRIAHSHTSHEWNEKAKELLVLILEELDNSKEYQSIKFDFDEPWAIEENNQLYFYSGFSGKNLVEYVSLEQNPLRIDRTLGDLTIKFAKLLGSKEIHSEDIQKIIRNSAPEELKGVIIDDYLVGKPVAAGGFAYLHKGINLNTGAEVAVKILKATDDQSIKDRFQQEAELMSRINHNNTVTIFNYGEEVWTLPKDISLKGEEWFNNFSNSRTKHCIFMDWVDGLTLDYLYKIEKLSPNVSYREVLANSSEILSIFYEEDKLKEYLDNLPKDKKDNERLLLDWFKTSALTLHHIHEQGLIHRDIKPSNIMITRFCQVKIMDFGIAKSYEDDDRGYTKTGNAIGTEIYMSPEQLELKEKSKELGPKTDIYSLGATFYELFTKTRVFDHDVTEMATILTKKTLGELPEKPRNRVKELSWELNEILMGTLQKELNLRYKTMLDLAEDLKRHENHEAILYKTPSLIK